MGKIYIIDSDKKDEEEKKDEKNSLVDVLLGRKKKNPENETANKVEKM